MKVFFIENWFSVLKAVIFRCPMFIITSYVKLRIIIIRHFSEKKTNASFLDRENVLQLQGESYQIYFFL